MKRYLYILLFLSLLFSAFTANAFASSEKSVCFWDDTGAEVTVSSPQRVAALSGSLADLWLLSGGELVCATQDALEERNLTFSDSVLIAGSLKNPSAEIILESGADFVLLTPTLASHLELGELLQKAGITVAYLNLETFWDYLRILEICTQITGCEDRYQLYGQSIRAQVDKILLQKEGQPSPTVLLLRAYGSGVKAKNSSNNLTGAMLSDLGCINIADQDESLLEDLSLEAILMADPDFIFITTMGADDEALLALSQSLQNTPVWASLKAVQQDRCYVLSKDLFHYKPNARWAESYAILAEYLYGL